MARILEKETLKKKTMYIVKKTLEISASHHLNLSYESKCSSLHGHNWIISIFCRAETLNQLDHKNLNEILPFNPTAENIARWVCDQTPFCFRVEVQESEGNIAIYEKD